MQRAFVFPSVCWLLLTVPVRSVVSDDWPQWRGPQRDGVWRETGIVESFATPQIPWKWSVSIGPGYCGPTVASGRVYVMDRQAEPVEAERVLCLDEQTGEIQWTHTYPCAYDGISYTAGPRASITIDRGQAFALGAVGHLHCLDAESGKVLWQRPLRDDFKIKMPVWGIAASPLVMGELVVLHIGGRDGACVVALDRQTGAERWRALDDRASYSAPIVVEQGGATVVVVWNGDAIAGLALDTGEVYWRIPFPPRNVPIGVPTPVVSGRRVFVSSFYDGSLMVELQDSPRSARTVWSQVGKNERNTQALHCMIGTPLFLDEHVYGVDSYGELRCLLADTGVRVWEDRTATPRARWSNIHMVRQENRVWMFNERGELVIGTLAPTGFAEISRAKLIDPTTDQLGDRGGVCWSHPAFANRHVFARNDKQIVCASLSLE